MSIAMVCCRMWGTTMQPRDIIALVPTSGITTFARAYVALQCLVAGLGAAFLTFGGPTVPATMLEAIGTLSVVFVFLVSVTCIPLLVVCAVLLVVIGGLDA